MGLTERIYAFDGWCNAQYHHEGQILPIISFDYIHGRDVVKMCKVVYDGELKNRDGEVVRDENGEVVRRKLWKLVEG